MTPVTSAEKQPLRRVLRHVGRVFPIVPKAGPRHRRRRRARPRNGASACGARLRRRHRRHQPRDGRDDRRPLPGEGRRHPDHRRRPHPRRRPRGDRRQGGGELGRTRRPRQQCRLRRHRAVPPHDDGSSGSARSALNVTALAMACAAAGRVMRGQAVRPDRQRHLARLAHGAPQLHRLRGEQGGGRFDHPRGGHRARALRRPCQQHRSRHDGH